MYPETVREKCFDEPGTNQNLKGRSNRMKREDYNPEEEK